MKTAKSLSWLVALAGLWEVLSPFILGYSATTVAMWNAIIAGVVLIVLGVWAALNEDPSTDKTLDWVYLGSQPAVTGPTRTQNPQGVDQFLPLGGWGIDPNRRQI